MTQVFSLGCNLHLFYPSFVLSAGPEPGKQIATVLVLRSSLASVVENGKRMRERGWGCGRKAFGSSRAGMLWFLPLTSSSSQLWSLCHASQFPHHHTDSINSGKPLTQTLWSVRLLSLVRFAFFMASFTFYSHQNAPNPVISSDYGVALREGHVTSAYVLTTDLYRELDCSSADG